MAAMACGQIRLNRRKSISRWMLQRFSSAAQSAFMQIAGTAWYATAHSSGPQSARPMLGNEKSLGIPRLSSVDQRVDRANNAGSGFGPALKERPKPAVALHAMRASPYR